MVSVVLVLPDGTREMKCRRRKKKKLVSLFSILSRFVCLLGLPSECQMMMMVMVMISSAFHYLSLHQWFPLAELSPEIYCCTTAFIQLKLQLYLLYFLTQLFSPYFQCSTFFYFIYSRYWQQLKFYFKRKKCYFSIWQTVCYFKVSRFLCHYYHLYY